MKIEIGGQRSIPGWVELNNRDNEQADNFNVITDEFDVEDNSVEEFYMSHVIEHMPILLAKHVCKKIYRKLKTGGKLRILTPDLEVILKAYVNNDISIFDRSKREYHLSSIPQHLASLGIGGYVMAQIINDKPPSDTGDSYLVVKNGEDEFQKVSAFSHTSCWDFRMMHAMLNEVGFSKIERTETTSFDIWHGYKGQLVVNAYK